MNDIEKYTMQMLSYAIESTVDDDLDEDGLLSCPGGCDHQGLCPKHEEALKLASDISHFIENHQEFVLNIFQENL